MKSKIYYILLIVIMGMSSCSDFLDQTSDSEFTDKDAFSTPAYTEYAINGIYSIMTWDEMYSSRLSLMYSENTDIEIVGASATTYNEQGNRGISNYYAEPTWAGHLNRTWAALYSGIERANLAIEQIPLSPAYNNSETSAAMRSYLGEALCLRALYYFELIRHFGDVPFKTLPTLPNGSNFYPPVADRDTIMDYLIEDLQLASEYMNWGTTPERMSKGFALGLMARIALWRGGYSIRNKSGYPTERGDNYLRYYQIANDACRTIIEEGPHNLTPSYIQIFRNLCQRTIETSYFENIYEVAMGLSRSSEIGYSIGVRFRTNPKYGFGNNTNVVSTTPYYFYQFDPSDLRRDVAVATYNYSNSAGDTKEFFQTNPFSWCIGKYDQRWMSQEFLDINYNANAKIGSGINWVMLRYADVLLMYAETENEIHNGPTPEARDALMQVRARAFSDADYTTKVVNYVNSLSGKEAFFNALVDERMLEFGGEGIRKYDLVRWNLLSDKIEEQRQALRDMMEGNAPYDYIPEYLHIKYNDDNETLDLDAINFYEDWGSTQIDGYEEPVRWMSGYSDSNKESYLEMVERYSSGLNAVIPNRHLFPIYTEIVEQSNGTIRNGYGW